MKDFKDVSNKPETQCIMNLSQIATANSYGQDA
jgi:hypothetical protein